METRLSRCCVAVDDHDRAIASPRDLLGPEARDDAGFGGTRGGMFGPRSRPAVTVLLEPPLADPNASSAGRRALAELMAKGLCGVLVAPDGCGAVVERGGAAGGEVLREPVDRLHGVRDRGFRAVAGEPAGALDPGARDVTPVEPGPALPVGVARREAPAAGGGARPAPPGEPRRGR
ncbi:VOC family protein [Kitasatospora sp. NPDC059327]|uniref:VOC family protein n=1 Tax=Kitasatospora sp. NPDC059327 TaxID=3346803 RepID=UPI003676D425